MTSSIGRSTFSEPSSLTSLLKIMLTGSSASIVASAVRVCSELLPSLPPAAVATAFNTLYGGGGDVASFINFLLAAVAKGLSPWTSVSNAVAPLASRSRGDFLSAQAAELVQVRASFLCVPVSVFPPLVVSFVAQGQGSVVGLSRFGT